MSKVYRKNKSWENIKERNIKSNRQGTSLWYLIAFVWNWQTRLGFTKNSKLKSPGRVEQETAWRYPTWKVIDFRVCSYNFILSSMERRSSGKFCWERNQSKISLDTLRQDKVQLISRGKGWNLNKSNFVPSKLLYVKAARS